MKRLQLTTTEGFVFLSPFVYSDILTKKKLTSMSWLVEKNAKMEAIGVGKYPRLAIYKKERVNLRWIAIIEKEWKEMKGDQDDN